MSILKYDHGHELCEDLVRVVRWIIVSGSSPSLVAITPPLLLERWSTEPLPVLDDTNQLWRWESGYLLSHHLLLLSHCLLMRQNLLVDLLVLLHSLKELPLFVMLNNLLTCLPVTGQDLLLLVNAKPHCFTLSKRYLHWS
jgi:hypothetical protein